MSLLTEIQKLKGWHFLVGVLAFLAVIGPGFLIIYRYHPELVEKYDIAKLLVFSASLTLPVLIANLIAVSLCEPSKEKPDLKFGLYMAAFGTFATLYGGLFLAYILRLSFRSMALVVAVLTVFLALFIGIGNAIDRRKKAHSAPTS